MNVRYRITLTQEEREQLRALVQAGKGHFRRLKRAQILLAASAGSSDVTIAKNVAVGASTVSPYLLQACGIASADKTPQVLTAFKACVAR